MLMTAAATVVTTNDAKTVRRCVWWRTSPSDATPVNRLATTIGTTTIVISLMKIVPTGSSATTVATPGCIERARLRRRLADVDQDSRIQGQAAIAEPGCGAPAVKMISRSGHRFSTSSGGVAYVADVECGWLVVLMGAVRMPRRLSPRAASSGSEATERERGNRRRSVGVGTFARPAVASRRRFPPSLWDVADRVELLVDHPKRWRLSTTCTGGARVPGFVRQSRAECQRSL
jgi:hypothetical protein